MTTAHKCPICEGRGKVSSGFYSPIDSTNQTSFEVDCKGCWGKGIVFHGNN